MKYVLPATLILTLLVSCGPSAEVSNSEFKASVANRMDPFKPADALKIIGAPCHQTKCDTVRTNDQLQFISEFTADEPDSLGRIAVVYYLYTEFDSEIKARNSYLTIREQNLTGGVQDLAAVGNRAYVHTDTSNFLYAMVQKDRKEIRIKLNKIVTTSTRENFLSVVNRMGEVM